MDDDSTPMSRTELAMLWDLLGRWLASHPAAAQINQRRGAATLRDAVDSELIVRFGG